ncbi:flagellar associated protein [Ectocarpus siliculosus]|uniref:Flagellar associated protein n=1 Tax=Ectocarpus siliculosus TaxID=2880 RepID=D7FKG1_ECTSI|nr:flagellar associated protein [Ectocarpus siliculosus]|eukprot:CBJ29363.1 flagellar associated protein [Ectocarpus siliculosus]
MQDGGTIDGGQVGGGKKGGEMEVDFNSSAFEALERDFQEVLSELVGDKSLERFRLEYEKLHRALKKSHEQEKRLIKKCRELNGEIVNNAAKVQTALKLSQEDQATIGSLRKEIEKAWTMVDVAHEKEVRAKDTINQLKEEISNLSKLVEKGAGLSVGQENMVKELIRVRDDLTRKTDEQGQTIAIYETQLNELSNQTQSLSADVGAKDALLHEARDIINSKDNEISREQRRRQRTDKELRDVRSKLDLKTAEHEQMSAELATAQGSGQTLDKQLSEARATMEKYLRDYDTLFNRTQKLTEDLEDQMYKNSQLSLENINADKEIKTKDNEIARHLTELGQWERKMEREKNVTERYRRMLEESKTPLAIAQTSIQSLEKEMSVLRKREELARKEADTSSREKGLQLQATQKAEDRMKITEDLVKEREMIISSLEAELTSYKNEVSRQRKDVFRLEQEREKLGSELSEAQNIYMQSLEDVKLRQMRINELGNKISDWEVKLKQQQQLYESVRSDRNLYSKNLIEAQDEIAEMKRKLKIMNHQIEQLKEDITAKDHALVKEHFDHQKAETQREQMRNEIDRMKRLLENNDTVVHKQDAEVRRLAGMLSKMDEDALKQRKEYDQVINERDILGTQLIRRNDELALLYEKLKIQQSTLKKGEAGYSMRLMDIRTLKLKCGDLMRDLAIARGSSNQMEELRREVFQLQRDLLQEKAKVKALSEELENPMNVHRWRKLEGSDPTTFEMIQKIHTLQKRLISKTEETDEFACPDPPPSGNKRHRRDKVVERDLLLQEKEKLYKEMKDILARQPGPEVAEQLSVYQASLKEKTRQMKAMASELNMYQAQVNEYKYEMERITRELQDAKRKHYEHKRREQMLREMQDEQRAMNNNPAEMQAQAHASAVKRFTGGGFAVN